MIQANELRIGNVIKWIRRAEGCKSEEVVVYNITRSGLRVYTDIEELSEQFLYFTECGPIPLTEDWFIRLGFEKKEADGGAVGYYDWFELGKLSTTNVLNGIYKFQDIDSIPFQYVHQLQNLYFALTGQELTIKS